MRQIITVRAIIKQGDKILLLRRQGGTPEFDGLYELPGGKVEFGQDPKAALQREVSEETGLEVLTMQLSDVYSSLDTADLQKQYISLVFWVSVQGGSHIQLSSEHNKYIWKRLSDIQLNEISDFTRTELQLEASPIVSDQSIADKSKIVDKNTSDFSHVVIYSDGGSRGNPGPSASGFVIKSTDDRLLVEGGKYLGITTNNQAEYQAVKIALEKAIELGVQHVQFRLDSQLVVNQLNGIYQIRNRDLWPIHSAIKELVHHFKEVTFTHVRREFNKEADAMVNKILDQQA
ncbi:MAG TPA: reverse transcriptase-like protein [Magnetospirillaceae bacterium]|nr:reverse transcriptase-like protein [Magnetospirillaceae bacterium]